MTRQKRRTYVLVVLLGIGALAVDRLLLRPDAAPANAHAGGVAAPLAGSGSEVSTNGTLTIPELPFPRELPPLGDARPFRDVFARISAERTVPGEATEKFGAVGDREAPSDSATFLAHHRLDAVMNNAGLEIAVINGVWLRVGQSIGECKLVNIEGTQARFVCRNHEAVLDLRGSSGLLTSDR